jgi:hypothetical protein
MRARGYSLPFVIMILLLLSVTLASLLFVLNAGTRSTESMVGRRKLFYACDGLSRITAVSAQNYFATTANPTSTALRDFICAEGGTCTDCTDEGCKGGLPSFTTQTPGFTVNAFNIASLGNREIAPLDSGPFEGMLAMQDRVDLRVGAQKDGTGWKCDVTQELSLGKIAMFQFFIFSDQEYTDWTPAPKMAGTGRVHANGDVCLRSNNGPLYLERVTASGNILPGVGCRGGTPGIPSGGAPSRVAIVPKPNFDTNTGNTDPIEPLGTAEQAAAAGSNHFRKFDTRNNATWKTDADTLYAKHLQDAAHDVPELKLPVFSTAPLQSGRNADVNTASAVEPNVGNSRLLVDPLRQGLSADAPDVRVQKFAFKADIRIINGVWYKRDLSAPASIGIPIWSDHKGSVSSTATTDTNNIVSSGVAYGQENLRTLHGWSSTPLRYSYYGFNADGTLARTGSVAFSSVVSYGTLFRDSSAGDPIWGPGVRCNTGTVVSALSNATCGGVSGTDFLQERLLRGTRSGFRDGHAQKRFAPTTPFTDARANILPINIDAAALQNALASCVPDSGELGTHFPGGCTATASGRKFNGVVYVSSTWSNQMVLEPVPPPQQGTRTATGAGPAPIATVEQTAVPEPLCTATAGTLAGGVSAPACSAYEGNITNTNAAGARPTAVRVFNARNINQMGTGSALNRPVLDSAAQGLLDRNPPTKGLSIVTNLPTYVLGDVNLGSSPTDFSQTSQWSPMLIAGDLVSLQSNNWNDANARWSTNLTVRDAAETTYNMQMLAGWLPTTSSESSGGLHNFPRFIEDWDGVFCHIKGSLVVGWHAVFAQWARHCCDDVSYQPPNRDWGFDRHLESILNQPPGAPLYDVQSTRRWKR